MQRNKLAEFETEFMLVTTSLQLKADLLDGLLVNEEQLKIKNPPTITLVEITNQKIKIAKAMLADLTKLEKNPYVGLFSKFKDEVIFRLAQYEKELHILMYFLRLENSVMSVPGESSEKEQTEFYSAEEQALTVEESSSEDRVLAEQDMPSDQDDSSSTDFLYTAKDKFSSDEQASSDWTESEVTEDEEEENKFSVTSFSGTLFHSASPKLGKQVSQFDDLSVADTDVAGAAFEQRSNAANQRF